MEQETKWDRLLWDLLGDMDASLDAKLTAFVEALDPEGEHAEWLDEQTWKSMQTLVQLGILVKLDQILGVLKKGGRDG